MTPIKLTKTVVDAAGPRAERYTVWDSEISGFGVRVSPTGAKSWIFAYRPGAGGRSAPKRRITLGAVGSLTPAQARKAAEHLQARVKLGADPQNEKTEARAEMTLAELATAFLGEHVTPKRRPGTASHYQDVLDRLVVPALGATKASKVKRVDVSRLHLKLKDTPFQANRVLATVASMYSFGSRRGYVPDGYNPASKIERYDEARRERYLTTEELERLGASIRLAETIGIPWEIDPAKKTKHVPKTQQTTVLGEHAAAALRLLIFTGCRLREILDLEWTHVDFERGLLLLPQSKTGRKAVILNAPALEILNKLTRIGKYVIAGDSAGQAAEKPRADLKRPWAIVSRHAKLDGVRLHDLRHSFASVGAGGGLGLPIIGRLLGHTQAATTQRYAHLDNDPLRRATNKIGETIAAAMGEARSVSDRTDGVVTLPTSARRKQ